MPKKKKITAAQLEEYIIKLMEYRDHELKPFIEKLQLQSMTHDSNPPTKPPKPPILR